MPENPTFTQTRLMKDAAFRLLVASVLDYAIFMLDPLGNVATWNAGAERIKGYRADEIVGQHFSLFYSEDDIRSGKPARKLELAAREGHVEDEGWRLRKDGTPFWANVVITALRDERGELVGFAKMTRDLTERRRAEEQRQLAAQKASRALEAINELSLALAETRSTDDVAAVILERGVHLASADTCFLYMLDEAGRSLELIGHRGVAPEIVAQARVLTAASGAESFAVMRAGTSVWAETAEEYARQFPGIAQMRATGRRARAFWCAPLVVEGKAVGLFGMGFYEERRFAPEERAVADALSKQCAQALVRAQRLEREERTRIWIATTLRSIGDAVIATDREGRVTLMNAVAEELTGWSEAEAKGRHLDEVFCIVSEETRKPVESPVTKVLHEGRIVGLAEPHRSVFEGGQRGAHRRQRCTDS